MIKKLALGGIVLTAMTSGAFAQGFIEAGVGSANTATDCTGMSSCKDSSTGFKASVGYLFSERFGLEAMYFNMGKITATGTLFYSGLGNRKTDLEIKTTGFGGGVLGLAPIGEKGVFNYRLGVLSAKSTADVTIATLGSGSDSKTSTAVYFGVGGGYHVTSNLTVSLEYDFFNAKDIADESYTSSLLSLSARFKL